MKKEEEYESSRVESKTTFEAKESKKPRPRTDFSRTGRLEAKDDVGNQVFPSTTKNSNTHFDEPHFFNAYDSMRNEREPRAIELALYTNVKKKEKNDRPKDGVRKRAET